MSKTKAAVPRPQPTPVDRQTLAEAIVRVSDGMRKLTGSGLNRKAIIVLLQHSTKVSNKQITAVLDGLDELAKEYTR